MSRNFRNLPIQPIQTPKNGQLILDWPRPQEITGNGWNASYRFHQPYLEKILTEGVERFGNVTVKRGTKVNL